MGGQEGSSSACWKVGWKYLAPSSRHCWCLGYTTALSEGWRIRRLGRRVWEERCLWESSQSWQLKLHCETSSYLFSLSPFTYQLPRALHKGLGQSQSSQIRKKTRHLAPSTSAKGALALCLWRTVTPAGAKDDSELLSRILSIWFYKVWGFISACNAMWSNLATHFQGGHPAGWGAAGCLAAARWGAWGRPRRSRCCSASRAPCSLSANPPPAPLLWFFTLLVCSGQQVPLRTVSFGGFLYFGCQRSSQMSEAEQSPFIGPVFQTTGVWSTPINSCTEFLKSGTKALSFWRQ